MRGKSPGVGEKAITDRIGVFLAQACDREGGRRNRLKSAQSLTEPEAQTPALQDVHAEIIELP